MGDALGETEGVSIGLENRAKVEARLASLEGNVVKRISGTGKGLATASKVEMASSAKEYNDSADVTMGKDGAADTKEKKEEEEEEGRGRGIIRQEKDQEKEEEVGRRTRRGKEKDEEKEKGQVGSLNWFSEGIKRL